MAEISTFTPRRYWGPDSTGDIGSPSSIPGQASVILARINERARARKAGKSPLVNGPCSEEGKEDSASIEISEDSRKLTQEAIASEEQLSIEGRKREEKHEEYSNEPNSTRKDEMVTAVNEVLSDEYIKNKKRVKRKELGDELDQALENKGNILVNDEQISYDMEVESLKGKKKMNRKEKESTGTEEVLLNGIDTFSGTEVVADDAVYKKNKKKEMEDQDRKNSLEEINCVSGTFADDSSVKSSQKRKKKTKICNTMDEENQVEKGDGVVKVPKNVAEDEDSRKLTQEVIAFDEQLSIEGRKKKKRHEKHSDEANSTSKDEMVTAVNEVLSDGYKKKKKRDKRKELDDELDQTLENRVNISVNDEQISYDIEVESPKKKKIKRKEKESTSTEEVPLKDIDTFSGTEVVADDALYKKKKKKKKKMEDQENRKSSLEEINCVSDTLADDSSLKSSKKRKKKTRICNTMDEENQVEKGDGIVKVPKNVPEDEDSRKLTQEVIAFDEQSSVEGRKKKKRREKYSNEPNSTSKDEMVTSVNEVLSDGYRKKKKRDMRKELGELDKTLENRVNILINDEQISYDMEVESLKKKKKMKRKEKESTSSGEVPLNNNHAFCDTEMMADDAIYKKKKNKKKEMEDQEDRKSSLEERNCVSDTFTDDSFVKSSQKGEKKNRICNSMDGENQVEKGDGVVKEQKNVNEDERHENCSIELNSTRKCEMVTTVNEVVNDGHKKKRKRDKRKEFGDELGETFANRVNALVNDEHISYDLEVESPKRKKMKRKEKESIGTEEVLLNSINTFSGTKVVDDDALYKKKKKKKKDMEGQENRKNSLEEINFVSDTFVDDSSVKSFQKKEKNRICNTMDEESQVEKGNDVVKELKNVPEDENFCELSKKKKKKRKEKGESEEKFAIIEDSIKSFEDENGYEDFSAPETKKKKMNKQVPADEENNVKISEINECGSNIVGSEKVLHLEEHHEKTDSEKGHEVLHMKEAIDLEVLESKTCTLNNKVTAKKTKRKEKGKKKTAEVQDGEIGGFTLIREVKSARKGKLQRALPNWLANPTVIGRDLHSAGASVDSIQGLEASLKKILEEQNIQHFFPVQKAVIPEILSSISSMSTRYRPRDLCVSAPTGSGKTLAYVLPIIQALKDRKVPRIRALVLLPVQELAIQVYKVFQTYKRGSNLKIGIAVGQSTFRKEQASLVVKNYGGYHSRIDILVATPGRLDDHLMFTKGMDLSSLRYLVVDEADRMLGAEGGEWVNCIEQAVKRYEAVSENVLIGGFQGGGFTQFPQVPIHRLLFSATLSHDPEQLQHMTLYRPKLFTVGDTSSTTTGVKKKELPAGTVVGQYVRPAELKEEYTYVDESVKPLILHHLITTKNWRRVLVFTNSLKTTHKLAVLMAAMSEGLTIAEFSSSQKSKRHQIVSQFASGKIDILISSDAMARGLDIPDIEHVVSYDVPSINTYIHRIGRTARAGKSGTALSLITKDVVSDFKAMLSTGGERVTELIVPTEDLEPYESLFISALAKMKEILFQEQQKQREEMEAITSRNKQGRRDLRYKGVRSVSSGVRKFVKRLQGFRRPRKVR